MIGPTATTADDDFETLPDNASLFAKFTKSTSMFSASGFLWKLIVIKKQTNKNENYFMHYNNDGLGCSKRGYEYVFGF